MSSLVKFHVRLVFRGFLGGVACALSRALLCAVPLGLLSVHWSILLGCHVLLGQLHLGLGLGQDGVAGTVQVLLGLQGESHGERVVFMQ